LEIACIARKIIVYIVIITEDIAEITNKGKMMGANWQMIMTMKMKKRRANAWT